LRAIRILAAAFVLATATVAGCGGSDETAETAGGSDPELVVFAAASLGPAFERYGDEIEDADVKFSFAGSDDLAAQIRQGVAPDVYAAANTSLPEELHADGLVAKPTTFVTNKLVVGVPDGSDIDSVEDLEEPGVEIAIGDEEVPVGIYTREVLKALGPGTEEAILANVASSEPDVAGIVGKLTQGAVDAGFIYRSDVDAAGGRIVEVPIPAKASPDVAYGIAVTSDAAQPELAQEFVDGVVSGAGRDILLESGFGPPPR
jgi:molybdate transport system substrate-binding protein